MSSASTSRSFANSLRFFANVEIMQFTKRQRLSAADWRPFAVALGVGLFLGFAGPFGSNPAYPTPTRYAFWLGLTAAGMAAAFAADAILSRTRIPAGPLRIIGQTLASSVPMTFVVAWTISFLQPGRVFRPEQLPALFGAVAAVQLLIVLAMAITLSSRRDADQPASSPTRENESSSAGAVPFPAAIVGKLAPELGSEILALETEDHYLRVHAAVGSSLILMRMADAVALLDPRLGMQVHRRWWVAEAAVTGIRSDGQKLRLQLSDNRLVPVGRTFLPRTKVRFVHASRIPVTP